MGRNQLVPKAGLGLCIDGEGGGAQPAGVLGSRVHCVASVSSRETSTPQMCDVSLGLEPVPILCCNNVDHDGLPEFEYINQCAGADDETCQRLTECALEGCCCPRERGCEVGSCSCMQSLQPPYDSNRRLGISRGEDQPPIVECTSLCGCGPACSNMVVSRGVQLRLAVFKTVGRGWGLRALEPICKGTFVCEYAGELISSAEARRRRAEREAHGRSDNYILCLREHVARAKVLRTIIDPTRRGNVGRFINHSCLPNLSSQVVRTGSLVPRLALFTTRDISCGTELTMSYGVPLLKENGDSILPPSERKDCLCGEVACVGSLPCEPLLDSLPMPSK